MTAITIRPVRRSDAKPLIAAHLAGRPHLHPWVEPFTDQAGFNAWFAQLGKGRKESFLVERDAALAGVINLNEIVRGPFLSAYLGYYGFGLGRGTMTEGLRLVLAEAFGPLGLHRVEANIQPGNLPSKALVQRLGFTLEGLSPRYLRIAGAWRDHERWARLADDDVAPQRETG
jgi:ribosomal-protein-alanine N-acetyltransferase